MQKKAVGLPMRVSYRTVFESTICSVIFVYIISYARECINIEAKEAVEAKRNAHLQAKKELEEKRRIADEARSAQIQAKKEEDERKRLSEDENARIQAEKDAEEKERVALGKHILLLHSHTCGNPSHLRSCAVHMLPCF